MKLSLVAIAMFLALVSPARGDSDDSWSGLETNGYVFGKGYRSETDVDQREFVESPVWEEKAENPPLSARKALECGDKLAGDLVKDQPGWRREMECLSLLPTGKKWIWQANYRWCSPKGRTNGLRAVPFLILMNGKAITPEITDRPDLADVSEPEASVNRGLRWYGHSGTKRYIYRIPNDLVNRSPAWLSGEQNPPVPARKAIRLANEFANRALIGSPKEERKYSELNLTPTGQKDKWLWIAVYRWYPIVGGTGPLPWAFAIILMDGTVVKPEIIDDPQGKFFWLGADDELRDVLPKNARLQSRCEIGFADDLGFPLGERETGIP